MKRFLFLLLFISLLLVAAFCAYKVYPVFLQRKESNIINNRIQDIATGNEEKSQSEEALQTDLEQKIDFTALQDYNPDIIAWIEIPGTEINYPVLHSTDNNKYLRHSPDGCYNVAGSIFLDCSNKPDFSDQHMIIYGHHMRGTDESMFSHLTNYKSQSFFEEHPYGILYTPTTTYRIDFFCGYVTKKGNGDWQTSFVKGGAYAKWLQMIEERNEIVTGRSVSIADSVITLSTCSYEFQEARYVLHGIIKK